MRLIHWRRTLFLTVVVAVVSAAFITVAHAEDPGCEYEGDAWTGNLDCVSWDNDEQPGGESGASDASHNQNGTSNGEAPVCRNGNDEVVPCSYQDDSGDLCTFANAVAAPPGSPGGGGAIYVCEPPADDDDDAGGDEPAVVDPVTLAWRATASMGLRAVDMQIAPTPVSDDPDSMGLVGLPVWLWTDDTTSTWGPQAASASDGPVSVTVTARVDRVEWDMGDGTTVTCTEPGTPFDPDRHAADDESPECGHIYMRTSDEQSDGVYTVTATSYWTAEWTDNSGQTGTIPFDFTATEQIRIGELQVIRTGE